jgi:hypothetical protein
MATCSLAEFLASCKSRDELNSLHYSTVRLGRTELSCPRVPYFNHTRGKLSELQGLEVAGGFTGTIPNDLYVQFVVWSTTTKRNSLSLVSAFTLSAMLACNGQLAELVSISLTASMVRGFIPTEV